MRHEAEVVVIGGGLVGVSIATGLRQLNKDVILLDEGDAAIRASRGNFGLVWVQGKGDLLPDYAQWARKAAHIWPGLAGWLKEVSGIDPGLTQPGGIFMCMTDSDLEDRAAQMARVAGRYGGVYDYEMLDNAGLRKLVPQIGSKVAGASYSPYDGQANPLRLFHALHRSFRLLGGTYVSNAGVTAIRATADGYRLVTPLGEVLAGRIVLASGLGNADLGRHLDAEIPVKPVKGQIFVTERVPPLFHTVIEQIRQTEDGTLLIGTSWEDVGFDLETNQEVSGRIARNAIGYIPLLAGVNVVRSWAALRIMSPDACPIYEEVAPGAFLVTCHSGVSLAAIHLSETAKWIADGAVPASMRAFGLSRFAVREVAE
jgi:glycine/D-amino acid oxidase-like deaminating enzyme